MDNLNVQFEFTETVKWVLKEIKKEELGTRDGYQICFTFSTLKSSPTTEDQRRAIRFLEKEKLLIVKSGQYENAFTDDSHAILYNIQPIGFYIQLTQPAFDEEIKKYSSNQQSKVIEKNPSAYWVTKNEDGEFLFNGNKVYIKSKNAQYYVIFDVAYSLKPEGGTLRYQEILRICQKRGRIKMKEGAINRALTGKDANFFNYTKDIPQTPARGIDLFTAVQNGKEIEFNNKK